MNHIDRINIQLGKYDVLLPNEGTLSEMFRSRYYTVEELLAMLHEGKLRYLPVSGNHGWTKSQQSRIVETIIRGEPQPMLMIDATAEEWYVITGGDELKAVEAYVDGELQLNSLFYSDDNYLQRAYENLPFVKQRRLMNQKFLAAMVDCGKDDLTRLWIYTTELFRRGIFSQRACRKVIFSDVYQKLADLTERLDCKGREDNVWMLLVMNCMLGNIAPDNYLQNTVNRLDFSIFISICMIRGGELLDYYQSQEKEYLQRMPQMVRVLKTCASRPEFSEKKKRCVAYLMACKRWMPEKKDLDSFLKVWKQSIDLKREPHRGNSMANLLACGFTMNEQLKI